MYLLLNELLRPYTVLLLAAAFFAVWGWRRRTSRWAMRLLLADLAVLLLLSLRAVSHLGLATLECQTAPLPAGAADDCQAIVVLSGALLPPHRNQPHALPAEDTLYRCLKAAEVYRQRPLAMIVSGGRVDSADDAPPLAAVMRDLLLELGVASADLAMEDRSTTTYENAVYCQRLCAQRGERRIVLVTDASHMPRAAACFRSVGLQVTEAPCHFITGRRDDRVSSFLPSAGAARESDRVVHEWLGLVWYWFKGRIE